jgi:5-methylcytosine-specific restriction endonuclease McrBC regulatory subunit McrC
VKQVVTTEEWLRIPVGSTGAVSIERAYGLAREVSAHTGFAVSELFDFGRASLTPKNWFGTVATAPVTLEVLPKGALKLSSGERATLDSNIGHLIEVALEGDVRQAGEAPLSYADTHLDRAVVALCDLILAGRRRRILRTYVIRDEETQVPRGALRFPEQAMVDIERPGVFASRWPELVEDTPELRYLKGVLEFVRTVVSASLRPAVESTLVALDEVPESTLVPPPPGLSQRLPDEYRQAIDVANEILQNRGRGVLAGSSFGATDIVVAPPVWEAFVRALLASAAPTAGLVLRPKIGERFLGSWTSGAFRGADFVELIPDAEIGHSSGLPLIVADAKWKELKTSTPSMGIDASDVHQLLAYATRLGCQRVALIYPLMAAGPLEPSREAVIDFPSGNLKLAVMGIPLLWRLKGDLDDAIGSMLASLLASP